MSEEVVVRFPPEASGYLHIGHAKAALINQSFQKKYNGKLILRFDDTNPAKENIEFEKVILEDVKMLQIHPDRFTFTSDYFDLMLECCEKLLTDGFAYCDDTNAELMKQQREAKIESVNRNNSIEKNLQMWQEMKNGSDEGLKWCIRAKIDMSSLNGCMRDPTIYRCKLEHHPRTGTRFKVYPTYDFACPIVDSIEGVTHTLRTMEYHDRDEQYYWFIKVLNLRKPSIMEFGRLCMTNTVLSKRKLTWFVANNLVDGWDDPRFPTVRGILRRGMTVEALRQFIELQGFSKSVVLMEWDKIWAMNKKVIDPIAPRFTALEKNVVPVFVKDAKTECIKVPKHPKNTNVGMKDVWIGDKVLIDYSDAQLLKENENTTFINWGNILIKKINRNNEKIESVEAVTNLDDKDFKKTLKITWLSETDKAPFTPCFCVYFDHIISKPSLRKDENFEDFAKHETGWEHEMIGDPELKLLKKGDIIQLQRKGFFIVDTSYEPNSGITGKYRPVVLFSIPDGHTKDISKKNNQIQQEVSKQNSSTIKEVELNTVELCKVIAGQGDIVRKLKFEKGDKSIIDGEVKKLLELKAEFKKMTGIEWKPEMNKTQCENKSSISSNELQNQISEQGDKVRKLKSEKADKLTINDEVKKLLELKAEFKKITGTEWKPEMNKTQCENKSSISTNELQNQISEQGDKIRKLKSEKAHKSVIDEEVKKLLELKAEFKKITGTEWKPEMNKTENVNKLSISVNELQNGISKQGDKVRKLKSEKADKSTINDEVKKLLELKAEFKQVTGTEWKPEMNKTQCENKSSISTNELVSEQGDKTVKSKKNEDGKKLKSNQINKYTIDSEHRISDSKVESKKPIELSAKTDSIEDENTNDSKKLKKVTKLCIEYKKSENLAMWYSQVLTKGCMIRYYNVSGCYVFLPWSYTIWEAIRNWFDKEITKLGVENCYFPMFVTKSALEKEQNHIDDFSPEVAWVTKCGNSDLENPVAIRPTSETVMYPEFADMIETYRDLPIKLNQWCNVVRWEFKHPQPFLRTREFLWQEGHTAYGVKEDAKKEVAFILDLYAKIYTDLLAVPVIKGRKTEKEKFAGAEYTYTIEAFISANGRGIQAATSHHLGQNFSKMFNISFIDPVTNKSEFVYQNSWGITTRTIGVMTLVHGDDKGLILPPNVAKYQVVIVPCGITANLSEEDKANLLNECEQLEKDLSDGNIRVKGDYSMHRTAGWKFNHWELKGVPLRVELGPKDLEKKQIMAIRRDTSEKTCIQRKDIIQEIKNLLETIQNNLFEKATKELNDHTKITNNWDDFRMKLDEGNIIYIPFCGKQDCEGNIKNDSTKAEVDQAIAGVSSMGAKSLCIPFDQPKEVQKNDKCIHPKCSNYAIAYVLFGRSY